MAYSFRFPYGASGTSATVNNQVALSVSDLAVIYPSGDQEFALEHVNLCIPVGLRVALVGPNGAGKSTLLKAIAGLLPVHTGDIRVFGQPVAACRYRIAYLPQRGDIDWHFPVSLRNLVIAGRYVHLGWFKRPNKLDFQIADQMIDRLGLSAFADRQIGQLSGGQQQRALLARALTQQADLLLLDEPLNAIDVTTRGIIADTLNQLKHEGKTVIAATHDLGRLETDFDGAVYLTDGHEVPAPPGSFTGIDVTTQITTNQFAEFNQKAG